MPKKGKIPGTEKARIVEEYLSGRIGSSEARRLAGVDKNTIRRWVSRYKTDGAAGLLPQAQNRKYSRMIKLAAVQDYLSGHGGLLEICEKHGILDSRQLREWIKVYNRHENFKEHSGGTHMTNGRETTQAERVEIARACIADGNNYGGTALQYRVSYQQVYTWTKKYREMGEAGLEDRRGRRAGTLPSRTPEEELRDEIARLQRKNFDLEMENALLKKVKELERRRR